MSLLSVKRGMSRKKENFQKCVYKISFINCDKIYIGSSCRWPYRKTEHLAKLKRQKHHNQYLQRSFNKYGLDSTIIEPLEFCEESSLREREQYWIDLLDSSNPKNGFNLVKTVDRIGTTGYKYTKEQRDNISASAKKRFKLKEAREIVSRQIVKKITENPNTYNGSFIPKTFVLFDPSGLQVEITNLNKFCRDMNLNYQRMFAVCKDKSAEYKGWKLNLNRERKDVKFFSFKSPDNEIVNVVNLRQFCKERNLSYSTMRNVHSGIGVSCRGWKKYNDEKTVNHKGKEFSLIDKHGNITKGNNLKNFCRENGMNFESLRKGCWNNGWKKKD